MEIGKLNQRITILEHRTVTDEIGNHITKWEENFSLWASVTSKSVTETTDAGVTKEVQKLEFLIRQSPASLNLGSTAFRILFRNNIGMGKYQFVLPFEVISVLLLACMIGAIMIARKR